MAASKVRVVLYMHESAFKALVKEAARRSELAGVEVTPEATSRAMLYTVLGFASDGAARLPHRGGGGPEPK